MALTVLEIKTAKPGMYADGGGLYLRVKESGTKSWIFRFTFDGMRKQMGLGAISKLATLDARAKVPELKKKISLGINPITAKVEAIERTSVAAKSKSLTFMMVASEYISIHRPSWNNEKHIQQWENTLTTYIEPIFKKTPIDKIDVNLVMTALVPIWSTKPETASRIRGRVEKILSYAKGMKYRTGENPATWRGNLDSLLPANSKVKRTKHHPALPYDNVSDFMTELRKRTGMASRALEFTILTASRSGAVRNASWSEFDLDKKIWEIPASHMKGKREHRVPLCETAINLLASLPRMGNSNLVFPSPLKENCPLSDDTLKKVIVLMNADRTKRGLPIWIDPVYDKEIVPHGFRSTFRDWAAESTSYAHELQEVALAHKLTDRTEAAYRRGDMMEKRLHLMHDWAIFCTEVKKHTL